MSLSSAFKNFGHAIATGAKYLEKAVLGALKVTAKVEQFAPEAELIIGALAGPQAAAISDLAFHALGDFATALKKINDDGLQAVADKGLVVQIDLQTIQDIRAMYALIEKLLAAKGTPAPPA